jgi:hypothetical protein
MLAVWTPPPSLRTGRMPIMGSEYPGAAMTPFFHPGSCLSGAREARARRSWRGATGAGRFVGADHIRSRLRAASRWSRWMPHPSLSTAAVASSRPREDAEAAPWHGSRRGVVLHQYYIKKLSKGPHINGMFAVIKR